MEKVRIQDDLYNHVNGEWLEQAVIPDDKPLTGGFADLATEVEELMIKEFNEMAESNNYPNNYLKQTIALYKQIKNVEKRNSLGFNPAKPNLEKLLSLKDMSEFSKEAKHLYLSNLPLPFDIAVETDMKNTDNHCLMIQGPSCILPDVTYYKNEQQAQALLGMWSQMASQIVSLSGKNEEETKELIEKTIKFDAIISTLVKSAEEWSEYTKIYNPMSLENVESLMAPFDVRGFFNELFFTAPETIIVADPRFLEGFKTLFNEETFELYKAWAYTMEAIGASSYLTEDLRVLAGSYRRALAGIAAPSTVEKYAYNVSSNVFSEPVGLYYGEKYFGEEAKKDVVSMVKEIIKTYQERILKNDFLSEATKQKAVLKLSTMEVKMGYPDKVNMLYDLAYVDENKSLYEIMNELETIKKSYKISQLSLPVDRTEWPMPGHMVNACYNPFSNDITFPAAILQAPFYSIKQTRSENLGGIGAVIGHEISHAFDNNGSQCDEKGNLNNWWTEEDFNNFEERTHAMIEEFDGIELPWGKTNGKFIVSENIADNGGMGCTLEIMGNMKEKSYEEYFKNWAKVWCMKAKPEYLSLIINIDVHAPAILRANMQPRNFSEWYETFGVTETDEMYLPKEKRVTIW